MHYCSHSLPVMAVQKLHLIFARPFFYMAFACCVNVYTVSVHTSST